MPESLCSSSSSINIALRRKGESQVQLQIYWVKICIFFKTLRWCICHRKIWEAPIKTIKNILGGIKLTAFWSSPFPPSRFLKGWYWAKIRPSVTFPFVPSFTSRAFYKSTSFSRGSSSNISKQLVLPGGFPGQYLLELQGVSVL